MYKKEPSKKDFVWLYLYYNHKHHFISQNKMILRILHKSPFPKIQDNVSECQSNKHTAHINTLQSNTKEKQGRKKNSENEQDNF